MEIEQKKKRKLIILIYVKMRCAPQHKCGFK